MSVQINANAVVSDSWTNFKAIAITSKNLPIQYTDDGIEYTIFAFDDNTIVYITTIWQGTLPNSVISNGYSQSQNDTDKTEFETYYKPYANLPIIKGEFDDPRLTHKLGNLTATSTSEVLVCTRGYSELSSQRQCSVQSSSVQDKSTGSGAAVVRITYLDSSYVLKSEDVNLNGTTKVNTVATDIRFIESFEVIQGAAAAGAISLLDGTTGGASEFCGISSGTTTAFLCHHYVPAGKKAWILNWGATVDDECSFKLNGQNRFTSSLVPVILDLEKLFNGGVSGTRINFERKLQAVQVPEKSYISLTVVPNQSTSTVIRSWMDIWETVT